ncbi:MAG TPA: 5-oxoprolinase subunit PxpA [Gemmatimonadales bacterium]
MPRIDLNADLGESYGRWRLGHDAELFPLVTSANIACGFHAGDPVVMRESVGLARRHGVAIGAHPGYPDLLGFGRRALEAAPAEIEAWMVYQIGALAACCRAEGATLKYVKPHGALYNTAVKDRATAEAIVRAVALVDPALVLLALPRGEMAGAAERLGLPFAREAFVDRNYEPDGSLTPRSRPDAVLSDPVLCADRAARMVLDRIVEARDGTMLELEPDSLCVHGDGPAALTVLRATRERLQQSGVTVAPFAP